MRKGLLLLAGAALLTTSLVAQAAQTGKPAAPQTAKPTDPAAQPPAAAPFKPAAERKETKVTEKVLKTYAGEYGMENDDRRLIIELKDGSLWGAPAGQDLRQLFPETQTVFFLKDLPVELTFKKDAKGVVTGLAMNQNGKVRDLKKMK